MPIWPFIVALIALLIIAVVVRVRRPSELEKLRSELGILIKEEKFEEALPLAERAVSLAEGELDQWTQDLGSHHTNLMFTGQLASSLGTLGQLHLRAENHSEAEACFQRAVAVLEGAVTQDLILSEGDDTPPPPHPGLPEALLDLSTFYSNAERFQEASSMLRWTLEIEESLYGADHPILAVALLDLASALDHLGDQGEAEASYLRAIALTESDGVNEGAVEIVLLSALNNLGQMYKRQGRIEESVATLQRALDLAQHDAEEYQPVTEGIRNTLAEIEESQIGREPPPPGFNKSDSEVR